MKKITKAVIPAAGFGTRMLPATKAQPKEMLTVVDKPTIQYIVEELVASGITDILIILGRDKHPIQNHFDHSYELEDRLEKKGKSDILNEVQSIRQMANFYYVRQEKMTGTASAVAKAKAFVGDEPFIMAYGDDIVTNPEYPVFKQRIDAYEKNGASVMAAQKVPQSEVNKYGIIKTTEQIDENARNISEIIEKPTPEEAPSNLASMGGYILPAKIFDYIDNLELSARGEYELPEAVQHMINDGHKYQALVFDGTRYDLGSKIGLLKANIEFGLKHPQTKEALKEYLQSLDLL